MTTISFNNDIDKELAHVCICIFAILSMFIQLTKFS